MQWDYMRQSRSYIETDGRGEHVQVCVVPQMEKNADTVIAMIESDTVLKEELLKSDLYSGRITGFLKCKFFTLISFGVNSVDWEKVVEYLRRTE